MDPLPTANRKVNVGRVLLTDYLSLVLAIFLPLSFLLGPFFFLIWLVVIPLLVRRVRFIKRTIEQGHITTGIIIRKRYRRGEWHVHYGFQADGQSHQVRNLIVAFKPPVGQGQQVEVAYNPAKPTQAFLPIFYAQPGLPTGAKVIGGCMLLPILLVAGAFVAFVLFAQLTGSPSGESGALLPGGALLPYANNFSAPSRGGQIHEPGPTAATSDRGSPCMSQETPIAVELRGTEPFPGRAIRATGNPEQNESGLASHSDPEKGITAPSL